MKRSELAPHDAHGMQKRQPVEIFVGLECRLVHQRAHREVCQQKAVELLPHQVRSFAAQNDVGAPRQPPRRCTARAARYAWALLLARIYEAFPLICPRGGGEMRIIAFITAAPVVQKILTHLGESTSAPRRQMAGTFQLLRSNDLIWSRMVHTYLMGEREPMTDLNTWNADGSRIPYRQHAE